MDNFILLVAGIVIVVNIIYNLLPDGSFEKYCKHILGLVLILVFLGSVTDINISSKVLDFDGEVPVYNAENVIDVIESNTKELVENKIKQHLTSQNIAFDDISVEIESNLITKVNVLTKNKERDKIRKEISSFCDIKIDDVVVE